MTFAVSSPEATNLATILLTERYNAPELKDWLHDRRFERLLGRLTHPREIARLAQAIAESREQPDDEKAKLEVLDEFESWRGYLADWFVKHPAPNERAALIASAVLDPGSPTAILDARDKLLLRIGESVETVGPLSGPGRTGYLKLLGASEKGHQFSISLTRHGLDEAVIPFVWTEWPQIQKPLQSWLLELPPNKSATETIERVAQLLVKSASRTNSIAFMDWIRRNLEEGSGSRDLALAILGKAVVERTIGARVRQRLLQWAGSNNEHLAAFVAEVCGGTFGQERPNLALKRLGRVLARPNIDQGTKAAENAVLKLANDLLARPILFDTVKSWLDGDQRHVGVPAFLTLAGRSPEFVATCLAGEPAGPQVLFFKHGWATAIERDDGTGTLSRALRFFLDACQAASVAPVVVDQVVGPVLADSLNKNLAMDVLRQHGSENPPSTRLGMNSLRSHLIEELIWGELSRTAGSENPEAERDD